MSRKTLAKDFRNIDPTLTRVVLVEGGPRILASFSPEAARRATRDLEQLGAQIWTDSIVTNIDGDGVTIGSERIRAETVLWAAGVNPSPLGKLLGVPLDRAGRVLVAADLSVKDLPGVYVAGDLAHFETNTGDVLPGVASVALQQGRYYAKAVLARLAGREPGEFVYFDKGQMATIGRSRAIAEVGSRRIYGFLAWVAWLLVHIYYLTGFRNRIVVLLQWTWSYFRYYRGARLILDRKWRMYEDAKPGTDVRPGA